MKNNKRILAVDRLKMTDKYCYFKPMKFRNLRIWFLPIFKNRSKQINELNYDCN